MAYFQSNGNTKYLYDNEKIIETGNVTAAVTFAQKIDGTESGPEEKERFALCKALKTISGRNQRQQKRYNYGDSWKDSATNVFIKNRCKVCIKCTSFTDIFLKNSAIFCSNRSRTLRATLLLMCL